jgi:tRNA threonylcarbamoyladenosine biosynthesis protein TsaE
MSEVSDTMEITADNVEATLALGRRLGTILRPGDVIALIGPLGSGKTTFVKGLAAGAQVADLRQVNSPTFVIVNEYEGADLRISHIDTYRLNGPDDLEAIGFDEMCTHGAVVVEWADRVLSLLPDDRLTLTLVPVAADRRDIRIESRGQAGHRLATALKAG